MELISTDCSSKSETQTSTGAVVVTEFDSAIIRAKIEEFSLHVLHNTGLETTNRAKFYLTPFIMFGLNH